MEQAKHLQLLPGVHLTAVQTRKFKTATFSLHLMAPLRRETASYYALLPYVLCQGTRDCPDRRSMNILLEELYGGTVTPSVRRLGGIQAVGFTAEFPDDSCTLGQPVAARAIRLLGDLLLRPNLCRGRLPNEAVEQQKAQLIPQVAARVNDKRSYAAERLTEELFRGTPLGVYPYGTEKQLAKVHYLKLSNLWQSLLAECPIELYYCGSLSAPQAAQAWTDALNGLPRQQEYELPLPPARKVPAKVRRVTEEQPAAQAQLAMGFRTGNILTPGRLPALMVLNTMLGGSVGSRLFLHVREELQLCYYASSALNPHTGILSVSCGTAPEQLQAAEAEILNQAEQLRQGLFTDEELEATRRAAVGGLLSDCDSPSALEADYLSSRAESLSYGPGELALLVGEVTREAVLQAAAELETDTVYTLRSPEEKEEQP